MSQIIALINGIISIVLLFIKQRDDNKREAQALRDEVYNAVESGDIVRLNALIDRINRMR